MNIQEALSSSESGGVVWSKTEARAYISDGVLIWRTGQHNPVELSKLFISLWEPFMPKEEKKEEYFAQAKIEERVLCVDYGLGFIEAIGEKQFTVRFDNNEWNCYNFKGIKASSQDQTLFYDTITTNIREQAAKYIEIQKLIEDK